MNEWVNVARTEEFPPGSHRVIDVDDVLIAVFNLDGKYYAIEDICTHDGGELASGKQEGCHIICPRHGARFDIRSGAALSPPAYENTATFPVQVENGMVQVRDDRWD